MVGKIFVNYRRDDSAPHALNVAQYMEREFGGDSVFLDIDRMRAGQKFDKVLEERLDASSVMLVVIGPSWLKAADNTGNRRLDDPEDWVRLEIARALARGIVVIPVLVGGGSLPKKGDLPDDLKPLVTHHTATITTNGFRNEMAGLCRDIRAEVGGRPWGKIAVGCAAALAAAGALAFALLPYEPPQSAVKSPQAEVAQPASKAPAPTIAAQPQEGAQSPTTESKTTARQEPSTETPVEQPSKSATAFRDCTECPLMITAPAGQFTMGSPESESNRGRDEGPQRAVTIASPFAVGKYEVTRQEFEAFANATGAKTSRGCWSWDGAQWREREKLSWRDPGFPQDDNHPVTCVSWNDAKAYASWLSQKTKKTYRLLTEAEWEYAARATTLTPFSTGSTISRFQANFSDGPASTDNGRRVSVAVGTFAANSFGLYDIHGNVSEWVEDCYRDSYANAPNDASPVSFDCSARVVRGGSLVNHAKDLRSADRLSLPPNDRNQTVGFRVALDDARAAAPSSQ